MRHLSLVAITVLLCSCGTSRTESQRTESQSQTTTRTTTLAEVSKPTPAGTLAVAESTKTVAYSEQVAQGVVAAEIKAQTKLEAPELEKAAKALANVAAPGLGALISMSLGWLTTTPDGAATGLAGAGLLTALTRRGLNGERELRKKTRHLQSVVKGNSDFMQAHPDLADKLKDAQRSAQVDPELKAAVKQIRVEGGLA